MASYTDFKLEYFTLLRKNCNTWTEDGKYVWDHFKDFILMLKKKKQILKLFHVDFRNLGPNNGSTKVFSTSTFRFVI